jgi:hypothetical protein
MVLISLNHKSGRQFRTTPISAPRLTQTLSVIQVIPMSKEFVGNANNLSSVEAPSVRIFLDHHYPKVLV